MSDLVSDDELDALLSESEGAATEESTAHSVRVDLGAGAHRFASWRTLFNSIDPLIARELSRRMFGLLHKPVEVEPRDVQLISFKDYRMSLSSPSSLSFCALTPAAGGLLLALDANLVNSLVNSFFGGGGRQVTSSREFSKTELELMQMMQDIVTQGLKSGCQKLQTASLELVSHDTRPQSCTAFSDNELLLLRKFRVEFYGGEGSIDLLMAGSAVDHLYEIEHPVAAAPRATDHLRHCARDFGVVVSGEMTGARVTLKQLLNLAVGDVIPVQSPEQVDVRINGEACFKAAVGEKSGRVGLRIVTDLTGDRR